MRTKHVFTKFPEVAHLWANKVQNNARHSSGNFFFEGAEIYSYGYHFPIAKHVENSKGETAVLVTTRSYSVSTSKHQNVVSNACNHLKVIYCRLSGGHAGGYGRGGEILSHSGNFDAWLDAIKRVGCKLAAARKPEIYLNKIAAEYKQAKKYADFFGINIPATLETAGNISNKSEYAEFEARRNELQLMQERAERIKVKKEHAKELKKWRTFESVYVNNTPMKLRDGFDYLRIESFKGRIQTSQGIEIPLEVGHKFYRLVKSIIAKGGCTNCDAQILHYSVKEINKDFILIGCHKITVKEVEKIAYLLRW